MNGAGERRRSDVQMLRALAVTLVVLGHAWPDLLPGGFVGVDVFFVISGYLVAGPMLRGVVRGERPAVGDFLARRARRILPAASLVAVATALMFCLVLDPLESSRYVGDGLASLLFVANFRLRDDGAGYFSLVDPSPFRHYWSLGVEEQFYLLLPVVVIVLVLLRVRGRAVVPLVAVVTAMSYVGGLWLEGTDAAQAFYLLPPRAWEFGVGALAALLPSLAAGVRTRWVVTTACVGAWVAILSSVIVLTEESRIPGPLLLPAVLGTALVLNLGGGPLQWSGRGTAPAVWLGDRSYAVYLTHWPPIAWLLIHEDGEQAPLLSTLAALAVAVVAAMLVHVIVERPLHRGSTHLRLAPMRRSLLSVGMVGLGVSVVALLPRSIDLQSERLSATPTSTEVVAGPLVNPGFVSEDVQPPLTLARTLNGLYEGCHGLEHDVVASPCLVGPGGASPEIVVLGDSHAANWYDAVRTALPGRRIAFLTRTSCPLYDLDISQATECDAWRASAIDYVRAERPKAVLLANYTSAYVTAWTARQREQLTSGWQRTLSALDSLDGLVVLGDVPIAPFDPPRCLARHVEDARACDFAPDATRTGWNVLERIAVESTGVPWVDTTSWFCDSRCASLAGNVQVWRDPDGHLTPESSRLLAPRLRDVVLDVLRH